MKIANRLIAFVVWFLLLVMLQVIAVAGYYWSSVQSVSPTGIVPDDSKLPVAVICLALTAGTMVVFLHYWAPVTVLVSSLIAFGLRWSTLLAGGMAAAIAFLALLPIADYFERRPPLIYDGRAQQRAVERFPELGVPRSPLNLEFLRRHGAYKNSNPAYFEDPEWPTKLAEECAADLGKAAVTSKE